MGSHLVHSIDFAALMLFAVFEESSEKNNKCIQRRDKRYDAREKTE